MKPAAVTDATTAPSGAPATCRKPFVGSEVEVSLLTGAADRPYAFGLATALIAQGLRFDLVAGDELDGPEFNGIPQVNFLNLRGDHRPDAGVARKVSRVLRYYWRLVLYVTAAKPRLFHILWNNKFAVIDRIVLMLYYRLMGKKITLTVHNVNAGTRDANDSLINRLTLRGQYRLADHIFVHTAKMKSELMGGFGVQESAITVIPFGINNAVPVTDLTPDDARLRLGIRKGDKTILFFGTIAPYKGLDYLIDAFQRLATRRHDYRLIIAGQPRRGSERYWHEIRDRINDGVGRDRIIQKIEYIPDEDTEVYFKAADVLTLPYTQIFQSGVLFLGYSFGLPVVAADVGSLREDIVEGRTGFVFTPKDPADLATAIETYFASEIFRGLSRRRKEIRDYANERHSWDTVGQITTHVYAKVLGIDE